MIIADNFVEKNSLVIKNKNKNSSDEGVWSTANGSYGFYSIPYDTPLIKNRLYYVRAVYKYTTTNQKPTWCRIYSQSGMTTFSYASVDNPVAGTEYTLSGFCYTSPSSITTASGTIYNGNSNAIAGVSAQVKNVCVYDVTAIYHAYLALGNNAGGGYGTTYLPNFKTWCDTNLPYYKYGTGIHPVTITDNSTKVVIKSGHMNAVSYVEADGMEFYTNAGMKNNVKNYGCYFDSTIHVSVYNNAGGGTVTHTRVDAKAQNSPFYPDHKYVLKITTNGTAQPGAGGFIASHVAGANKIFIEKFVAKVPVGYNVVAAYNSQGTGSSVTYLTSMAGTGDWAEYAILYKCGSSGSFSSGGHVYISGSNNTSVTWYLAYVNNCEITGKEYLKNYSVLPSGHKGLSTKDGNVFTNVINSAQLVPNGDFEVMDDSMKPSSWTWDTEDTAGNGKASLVQPVGAGAYTQFIKVPINPLCRYKISYWVKCKGDMGSFLTAIDCRTADGTGLTHGAFHYYAGTKTQLTQALNPGDTTMKVKSTANWQVSGVARLGFRGDYDTYNTGGTWSVTGGAVSSVVDSTTIQLRSAYTGTAKAVNQYIVESYDGGTYPYPIQKGNLPTNNTWKYVEGYFGLDRSSPWDGSGSGWSGGVCGATVYAYILLNIYSNNGTVPIKYCDIKVTPVTTNDYEGNLDKIQIK